MAIKIFKVLTKVIKILTLIKKGVDVLKSPKAEDYLGKKNGKQQ